MSNGPPAFASGPLPGGPRFPPAGSVQQPPVGPPSTLGLAGATPQAPSMRSFLGNQAVFAPSVPPVQPAPPFSASAQSVLPPPGSYGTPTPAWQMQPGQVSNGHFSQYISFSFKALLPMTCEVHIVGKLTDISSACQAFLFVLNF